MEKTFVINWKARTTGRTGQGKKLMDQEEAQRLALELNREYPDYEHFAVETGGQVAPAAVAGGTATGQVSEQSFPPVSPVVEFRPEAPEEQFTDTAAPTSAREEEVTAYDNHPAPAPMPQNEAA